MQRVEEESEMSENTPLIERARKPVREPPPFLAFRSSKGFIIFTVTAALFTDTILYAVVVPVFPFALHERAGIAPENIQWWESFLFALFGAIGLIFSPICGYFADRSTNRQAPFMIGLIMAAFGTILFGIAEDAWLLAASRVCQAMASTIVFSVGLAVVTDTVPKGQVGQSMGIALSGVSIGYILSPTLGGIVYEHLGYTAVFGVCAGLLGFDVLLRVIMVEKKTAALYSAAEDETDEEERREHGINDTSERSHRHGSIVSVNPVAAIKAYKNNRQVPLVVQFFIMPRFFAAFWGYCIYVAILGAYDCVLALYVKRRFGWNAMHAGLIYLTLAIPNLTAPWVGHWAEKMNPRLFSIAGFILAAPLQALLLYVDEEGPWEICLLILLLTLTGCSITLDGTPLASEMSDCVAQAEKDNPAAFEGYTGGGYAQAFSLLNVANSIGLLVGTTFAGALIDSLGWKTMSVGLGVLTLLGAVPSILLELSRAKTQVISSRSNSLAA